MRKCSKCGADLPLQTGRGRRRKMCEMCAPPRRRQAPAQTTAPTASGGSLTEAVRAELDAAGLLGTAGGFQALALAQRIDADQEPGAALAALNKELRAQMNALGAAETEPVADPVDELKARRAGRSAS